MSKHHQINTSASTPTQPDIEVDFSQGKPLISEYKVNKGFITLYALTMAINGICVAWTTGGNNQTANLFAAKLNWTEEETRRNNTLINFASQIGKASGALIGGFLIQGGRKRTFLGGNIMTILACLLMQILALPTLVIGKFLHGFFVTVVHIAQIKMLNETVPVYLLGRFGPLVQQSTATGYLLVLGFGLGLPGGDYNPGISNDPENDAAKEADLVDNFWRFIYIFPLLVNVFMLTSFLVFIKSDSIMFNLSHDRDEEAFELIDKVYDASEDRQAILEALKLQCHKKQPASRKLSYCRSIFGPRFWKSTVVAIFLTMFTQQSGANVFTIFSNRIVTILNAGVEPEKQVTANVSTQLLGIVTCVTSLMSTYFVQRFPRKKLFLVGQILEFVSLGLLSLMLKYKSGWGSVSFMLLFTTFFQFFIAPTHWIYVPEILTDAQFGFVATIHYLNGVELSLATEYLVKFFQPEGAILFHCTVTFLGIFFMYFVVKETSGLTDKQKKQLYVSKRLKKKQRPSQGQGGGKPRESGDTMEISIESLEDAGVIELASPTKIPQQAESEATDTDIEQRPKPSRLVQTQKKSSPKEMEVYDQITQRSEIVDNHIVDGEMTDRAEVTKPEKPDEERSIESQRDFEKNMDEEEWKNYKLQQLKRLKSKFKQ